jgi:hypothetical protein
MSKVKDLTPRPWATEKSPYAGLGGHDGYTRCPCSAGRNRAANRRQTVNGVCAMNVGFAAPVRNKAGFWLAGIFATIALWNAL